MDNATYLGDGVYIKTHQGQLLLYTANGIEVTNKIYLEPEVAELLVNYINKILNVKTNT